MMMIMLTTKIMMMAILAVLSSHSSLERHHHHYLVDNDDNSRWWPWWRSWWWIWGCPAYSHQMKLVAHWMISVFIFGFLWWSSQNPDNRETGSRNVLHQVGICRWVMMILMMNSMRTRRGRGRGRGVVWSTPVIANLQLCKSTDVPQLCGERDASRLCEHYIELR